LDFGDEVLKVAVFLKAGGELMVGLKGRKKGLVGVSGVLVFRPDQGFLVVEFYEEIRVEELEDAERLFGGFGILFGKESAGVDLVELDGLWVPVEAGLEELASGFLVFSVEGCLGGKSEVVHGGLGFTF